MPFFIIDTLPFCKPEQNTAESSALTAGVQLRPLGGDPSERVREDVDQPPERGVHQHDDVARGRRGQERLVGAAGGRAAEEMVVEHVVAAVLLRGIKLLLRRQNNAQ